MSWREQAAPLIARVLHATAGRPEAEVRAALDAAYPWGERAHHPWRIWCDEIARQRGRRPRGHARAAKRLAAERRAAGQLELGEGARRG